MTYEELIVLIPSHSLEDFPTDLGEKDAASLLNAFAVPWHPVLMATAGVMPGWHRADEPPETLQNRLFLVPLVSGSWIPSGWIDRARSEGAVVVEGLSGRDEMLQAALEPLGEVETVDDDLAGDFLALGSCYLQGELLTRYMHHFSNLDEVHLQREAVAAARAAVSGDGEAARTHLRSCFDVLTEVRERYYPVDCYLLDLCLLIPRLADEHLERLLGDSKPVSLLATAEDLEEIAGERPQIIEALRQAWERGTADVAGGEFRETPIPLTPLESLLWNLDYGRRAFRRLLGRVPNTWARRRFGLATAWPQLLVQAGYHSALHLVMDDGLYPDEEHSKVRWEGCDGTVIESLSRIPLAGDSATSFLRFAQRMAESMEQDHVAGIVFARWPELKSPWLDDFRRMHNYAPALGRFVTLDEYFQHTDSPGRLSRFEAQDYFSPFLVQSVARQEANPISRYADHFLRRHRFEAACWYEALAAIISGERVGQGAGVGGQGLARGQGSGVGGQEALEGESGGDVEEAEVDLERVIEDAGPDGTADAARRADELLREFETRAARRLAERVTAGGGQSAGYLLLNPLSFARRVTVELPELETPPNVGGPVKAVQFDDHHRAAVVEMPPAGFLWIGPGDGKHPTPQGGTATAEDWLLRNEFFEVHINETTGGINHIKGYGRSPKRLSQQLAYRFPRERVLITGEGEQAEETKSYYSEMRCRRAEVVYNGPALGEIVTEGEIVDQKNDSRLAGYRQTYRVWRGRPVVEIEIELEIDKPPEADPWTNYYACRFAWNDSTAPLTRAVLQGAQGFRGERFDSPHYLEIADEQRRTTILNMGLPFYRKTGPRMLDSLLVVAGETRRRFRYVIAVDENYPMQAALDAMIPVAAVPRPGGPPRAGESGWFFHLNSKNVQITRILDLSGAGGDDSAAWEQHDREHQPPGRGFALRLLETEGRAKSVKLQCFQTPHSARQRDFQGRTLHELAIEGDSVLIEMTAYEIADVELRFE